MEHKDGESVWRTEEPRDLSEATNRSVQFSGERNVDPVQLEDQAGRG